MAGKNASVSRQEIIVVLDLLKTVVRDTLLAGAALSAACSTRGCRSRGIRAPCQDTADRLRGVFHFLSSYCSTVVSSVNSIVLSSQRETGKLSTVLY
jgi:hypothetical protein